MTTKFSVARISFFFAFIFFFLSNFSFAQTPPINVTLWFDTEDYILPQSDDAAKRLAEMLTRLGIKATFKIVGEKARVIEQRGRKDVIEALKKHEIGYHSNLHSQHPTPAEYLQNTDWNEGVAEFYRRESQGVKDIQRIFGQTPSCYGQPGSSWGAQAYPALKKMGINVYLDEANHVGIDDQPFYYGGMLNIFKMRSNVVRMELFGENNLANGKAKFLAAYEKLKAKGGGTISIYYHPCEWVHQEFWDGVNFSRGANPEKKDWKLPKMRSREETEKAFQDFEEYVKFIKVQEGVKYVTANELKTIYSDESVGKKFSRSQIELIATKMLEEISWIKIDDVYLSPSDSFSILQQAASSYLGAWHTRRAIFFENGISSENFIGPKNKAKSINMIADQTFSIRQLRDSSLVVSVELKQHKSIPSEVRIGDLSILPEDYLATISSVILKVISNKKMPENVVIRKGNFTAAKYVADDDPKIFNWVIHPEGFHAPKIMELAKLQAWTLKPAVMKK